MASLGVDGSVKGELDFRLKLKADDFEDAITRAAGLVVDPLADRETVAPDEAIAVENPIFNLNPILGVLAQPTTITNPV